MKPKYRNTCWFKLLKMLESLVKKVIQDSYYRHLKMLIDALLVSFKDKKKEKLSCISIAKFYELIPVMLKGTSFK